MAKEDEDYIEKQGSRYRGFADRLACHHCSHQCEYSK